MSTIHSSAERPKNGDGEAIRIAAATATTGVPKRWLTRPSTGGSIRARPIVIRIRLAETVNPFSPVITPMTTAITTSARPTGPSIAVIASAVAHTEPSTLPPAWETATEVTRIIAR